MNTHGGSILYRKLGFVTFAILWTLCCVGCTSTDKHTKSEKGKGSIGVKMSNGAICDPVTNKLLMYPPNDIGVMKQNKNKKSGQSIDYCSEKGTPAD